MPAADSDISHIIREPNLKAVSKADGVLLSDMADVLSAVQGIRGFTFCL
jgi:hypothetical protein